MNQIIMFKKNYLVYTVTVLFALLMVGYSFIAEKNSRGFTAINLQNNKVTTGAQDRAYWSDVLYKISYPVIHNLAEGTLKKNMPLEISEGYGMPAEKVLILKGPLPLGLCHQFGFDPTLSLSTTKVVG